MQLLIRSCVILGTGDVVRQLAERVVPGDPCGYLFDKPTYWILDLKLAVRDDSKEVFTGRGFFVMRICGKI